MTRFLLVSLAVLVAGCTSSPDPVDALRDAAQGEHRPQEHIERNQYRHPVQTLRFFEVEPQMTVVEVWPGGAGWYTEVLAPFMRDQGTFYAAQFPPDSDIAFYTRNLEKYREKIAAKPGIYDQVKVTHLWPPRHTRIAPPGSADRVLTFRNVHNWALAEKTDRYFEAFFKALKPGGILGVVEHRAPEGRPLKQQIESGYMTEDYVIRHAEKAGFKLVAEREINATPRDAASHPEGVWTLPPTLRLGEKNREKYRAIGESDRITLKVVKPEQSEARGNL